MRANIIKALIKFFAYFPLRILHAIGHIIGATLYALPNNVKKRTRINVQHCLPEKTTQEQDLLVKSSLIETAKTTMEIATFWSWPISKLNPLLQESASCQLFKDALAKKQAIIVLTPHLGAWEMVGLYCARLHPITCMYRPPRLEDLEPIIKSGRARMNIKLAPTDQHGIRILSRVLKQNETIGILPDQDPGKNGGMYVPFFNQPANTMTLASRFALKTKCPVFCIYAERLPKGQGYLIHCEKAPSKVSDGTLEESVTAVNQLVEKCIRQIPSQYQWSYKRFKNPPPGERNIYRRKR